MKRVASIPGDLPSAITYATEHIVDLVSRIENEFAEYRFALHRAKRKATAAEPPEAAAA